MKILVLNSGSSSLKHQVIDMDTEEMLVNTGYGFVCDNSAEGISEKLLELLGEQEKLDVIRQRLQTTEFSNSNAIEKFIESLTK